MLCWIPAGDPSMIPFIDSRCPGFNPCCAGSLPATGGRPAGLLAHRLFQSLLCWIPAGDGRLPRRSQRRSRVSILVVLDPCRRQGCAPSRRGRPACFNPCCAGSLPATAEAELIRVVEEEFQSLLCWIPAGDMLRVLNESISRCDSFNPCCAGSLPATPALPASCSGT